MEFEVAMEMKPAPAYMVRIDTVTRVSISIDLSRPISPRSPPSMTGSPETKGCIGLICAART